MKIDSTGPAIFIDGKWIAFNEPAARLVFEKQLRKDSLILNQDKIIKEKSNQLDSVEVQYNKLLDYSQGQREANGQLALDNMRLNKDAKFWKRFSFGSVCVTVLVAIICKK